MPTAIPINIHTLQFNALQSASIKVTGVQTDIQETTVELQNQTDKMVVDESYSLALSGDFESAGNMFDLLNIPFNEKAKIFTKMIANIAKKQPSAASEMIKAMQLNQIQQELLMLSAIQALKQNQLYDAAKELEAEVATSRSHY